MTDDDLRAAALRALNDKAAVYAGPLQPDGSFEVYDRDTDYLALARGERELLAHYGNGWVPRVLRLPEYEWSGTTYQQKRREGMSVQEILHRPSRDFSRGFVSRTTLPAAAFTPELARAVFGAQPCISVVLSDREPDREEDGIYRWYFYDPADERDSLPMFLKHPILNETEFVGETREEMFEFLSDRCVRYGRSVGLPPARG